MFHAPGVRSRISRVGRALRPVRRWRPLRCALAVYRLMDRSRALGLSAEVAFWFFLALVPLAAVLGMLAVKLTIRTHGSLAPLVRAVPGSLRTFVAGELVEVSAWQNGTVAPVAGAVFVWLASSGLHSVFDVLELETGARPRAWWKKRLLSIGCCLLLSFGVALLAALGPAFREIWRITRQTLPAGSAANAFGWAARISVSALVWFGLVAALYRVGIPRARRKGMPVAPGAILAIALQFVLVYGYQLYIVRVGDGGAYLASLAAIGVTMITLYLMATALLAGAELNRLLAMMRVHAQWKRAWHVK